MKFKWLPNILTSIRVFLVPIFIYFLFSELLHGKLLALIIFIIAALTDAFDGRIARKHNITSKFGTFFDPLADKFLVLAAFYSFMFFPLLSSSVKLWMIILISFRDIFVTILRTIMQYKGITMITSKFGKIKTALQFVTIHLILIFLILKSYSINEPYILFFNEYLYILMIFTSIITFYTGVHYIYYNFKTLENIFIK